MFRDSVGTWTFLAALETSWSPMKTSPALGCSKPAIIRMTTRLPASRRAEQREALAVPDRQRETLEDPVGPEDRRQVLQPDIRHGRSPHPAPIPRPA